MIFHDLLYGRLEFTEEDLKLLQTKELTRLRQVFLSAIPPWTLPTSTSATKFEHTLGVAHLARIVGQLPDFESVAKDLYFAAIAHDIGTPPFSHAGEYVQIKLFGKNHEQFVENILAESELAELMQKQGGSVTQIAELVKGKARPISDLINGTMDLDNLDNTLRFNMSMGLMPKASYSPEQLALAYFRHHGELALQVGVTKKIADWEECRKIAYRFVYSPANLAPGMMLVRALDFAALSNELTNSYFSMTDPEAFLYLKQKCNQKTKTLIERLERWRFYQRVFNFTTTQPTTTVKRLIDNPDNLGNLADLLSSYLKIPPEDICVYLGKNKGYKKIHIPIVDAEGNITQHTPTAKLAWMAQVFLNPRHLNKSAAAKEFMKDKLELV